MNIAVHCFYEDRNAWQACHQETKGNKDLSRFLEGFEDLQTVIDCIKQAGYEVHVHEINSKGIEIFKELEGQKNVMVWNLTDGTNIYKGSHIPAIADLYHFPHIGSNSFVQMLAQDKDRMRRMVDSHGVKVPAWANIRTSSYQQFHMSFKGPYFIKPTHFDNGIGENIVYPICASEHDIQAALKKYHEYGIEYALVDELLQGKEYTVALINTGEWKAQCFAIGHNEHPYWDWVSKDAANYALTLEESSVSEALIKETIMIADKLGINDYFRVDYRCDNNNTPRFLEINTNPFLICKAYTYMSQTLFSSRSDMLKQMINASYRRQLRPI